MKMVNRKTFLSTVMVIELMSLMLRMIQQYGFKIPPMAQLGQVILDMDMETNTMRGEPIILVLGIDIIDLRESRDITIEIIIEFNYN